LGEVWKALAIDIGRGLEAYSPRRTISGKHKVYGRDKKPYSPPRPYPATLSTKEKERRMRTGACLRCGKRGHIAKDCWTGPHGRT